MASSNEHKKKEFTTLLGSKVLIPSSFECKEDGETFEENSLKKLLALKKSVQLKKDTVYFADDSGLVLPKHPDILGVYTSRFMGNVSQNEKNSEVVKIAMGDSATYVCCISFCTIDSPIYIVKGTLEGTVSAYVDSGSGGFGYDPIFIPLGYLFPVSTLGNEEKQHISHRFKACQEMKRIIDELMIKDNFYN